MDEMGVDVQVLSLTVPGLHNFEPAHACDLAVQVNDQIAAAVSARPNRFQGFATLPTPSPQQAADELERAVLKLGSKGALVHGRTRERNMDLPKFEPIYAMAEKLRVPVYLNPHCRSAPSRRRCMTALPGRLKCSSPAPVLAGITRQGCNSSG